MSLDKVLLFKFFFLNTLCGYSLSETLLLSSCNICFHRNRVIESNLNSSNNFGTMEICLRYG